LTASIPTLLAVSYLHRDGFRWNGDINDPEDKGNPRSHGQGTWTILPTEIGVPLATLAETFQRSYAG
jgi:hypothetical protein